MVVLSLFPCKHLSIVSDLPNGAICFYFHNFIEFLAKCWLIYFFKVKRLDNPVKSQILLVFYYRFVVVFGLVHLIFLNCWWHSSTMSLCVDFRMFHKILSCSPTPELLNGFDHFKKVKLSQFYSATARLVCFIPVFLLSFKFGFGGFYNGN